MLRPLDLFHTVQPANSHLIAVQEAHPDHWTSDLLQNWHVVADTGWRRTAVMARTDTVDVARQYSRGDVHSPCIATIQGFPMRIRSCHCVHCTTYTPHVGHDNDTFTSRTQEAFTLTRAPTTLWMGDFNTKLTTDGHLLKHSYKHDAGGDRIFAHLMPTTRPQRHRR